MILELRGAQIAERGVEPPCVVDLVDEAGKIGGDILESIVVHQVDGFDLQRLHEALGLGVMGWTPPVRADLLWNSSTVAHATRWQLDLPDRDGVFGYMKDVLSRQLDRVADRVDVPRQYFYELSIRHEDMHVEALAYTRQTLGYARPEGFGHLATHAAGAWPGDVEVPGGFWRLGSTPTDGFIFDNEKWAHEIAKTTLTLIPYKPNVPISGIRLSDWLKGMRVRAV